MREAQPLGNAPFLSDPLRRPFELLVAEVVFLHAKRDFFEGLYGDEKNVGLLAETALLSFQIINQSVRHDVIAGICRLNDPAEMYGDDNLSLEQLAKLCPDVPVIREAVDRFHVLCRPIKKYRHKFIGHNDLAARIDPDANPIPEVSKEHLAETLDLAAKILNMVAEHRSGGKQSYSFTMPPIGGAGALLGALGRAQEARERFREEIRRIAESSGGETPLPEDGLGF